jgi:tRNA (cytidine56-2'-O)-methyltransferase
MNIAVIRLSERGYRDQRITTHCALVARAWGAQRIILSEDTDPHIGKSVDSITQQFGGTFKVEYEPKLLQRIKQMKKEGYMIIHLTMYGEKPTEKMTTIRKSKKIAIVIGSEKVEGEVYRIADYNVGITRQPHSEVAALAVFLHYLREGKEEKMTFPNARKTVEPNPRGKTMRATRDI